MSLSAVGHGFSSTIIKGTLGVFFAITNVGVSLRDCGSEWGSLQQFLTVRCSLD